MRKNSDLPTTKTHIWISTINQIWVFVRLYLSKDSLLIEQGSLRLGTKTRMSGNVNYGGHSNFSIRFNPL